VDAGAHVRLIDDDDHPTSSRRNPLTTERTRTDELADRSARALKHARAAQRRAIKLAQDEQANRSTRQQRAQRHKADALDQILLILAGRD
jgi:hypothetical protein